MGAEMLFHDDDDDDGVTVLEEAEGACHYCLQCGMEVDVRVMTP